MFPARERGRAERLDQRHHEIGIARRPGMREGLVRAAGGDQPRRGPRVERGHRVGRQLALEMVSQDGGEEAVEAVPAPRVVERQQEQLLALQPLEQRRTILAAGDGVAERGGQALENRRPQEERPHGRGLPRQHLLRQVIDDEAVAAAEGGDRRAGIGVIAQRQRGQLQPGDPALGARRQRRGRPVGERRGQRGAQECRRLVGGEAQVGRADLGQLPPRAQTGQRERRIGPAGDDQVQSGRGVVEQERERGVDRRRRDRVVVVEDQGHVAVLGGDPVQHRDEDRLDRRRRRGAQQPHGRRADPGAGTLERGGDVPPEARGVVVARVEGDPGDRAVSRQTGPEQCRLAAPGGGGDEGQFAAPPGGEPLQQARAIDEAGGDGRRDQLRVQQFRRIARRPSARALRRGCTGRSGLRDGTTARRHRRRERRPLPGREAQRLGQRPHGVRVGAAALAALQRADRVGGQPRPLRQRLLREARPLAMPPEQRTESVIARHRHPQCRVAPSATSPPRPPRRCQS